MNEKIAEQAALGIVLFHGGRRWAMPPQIRPVHAGRYEYGPGIYLTTGALTSQRYAKGGGVNALVTLDPETRFLSRDLRVELDAAHEFIRGFPGLSAAVRRQTLEDLSDNAQRRAQAVEQPSQGALTVNPQVVLNLLVNSASLGGGRGVRLAAWLVDQGVDAAVHQANGVRSYEDWVVVFNPQAIANYQVLDQSDIDWANPDLPSVREQLEQAYWVQADEPAVNRHKPG